MGAARTALPSAVAPPLVSQFWLALAVASIGLAALAAVALVLARTPLLTALIAPDAFPRALVVHVNFATLVWYFAMAGTLWSERLPPARLPAATAAFALGFGGALGMALAGVVGIGAPVLANYVPYLSSAVFVASLACFAAGGLATALLTLQPPRDEAEWGFLLARWPFVMAALYLVARLVGGATLVEAVWGAGHILQFGYVTLLMAIWLRLAERTGGEGLAVRAAIPLFAASAAPATLAPVLYLAGALDGVALHDFHTTLMRWANWPAPVVFGLLLLASPAGRRSLAIVASLALLGVGCLAGMAIDAHTTMVPAHYHGTIGAFTLALMAAALARIGPAGAVERNARRGIRLPLALYAGGSLLLIAGLGWSGMLGAPRKAAFSAEGAELAATLSAALTGLGGIVTIGGVILFVVVAVPGTLRLCMLHPDRASPGHPPRHAATFAAAR